MPRPSGVLIEHNVYELVPRAREGRSLPPTATTNEFLLGILNRTLRDETVDLSNFVWMNNHSHIRVLPSKADHLRLVLAHLIFKQFVKSAMAGKHPGSGVIRDDYIQATCVLAYRIPNCFC